MAFLQWLSRCVPGLSLVTLLVFLECTLGILRSAWIGLVSPSNKALHVAHPVLLWIFVTYSVFLHFMSWIFPLRLCWAAWTAASKVEETHKEQDDESTMVNTPEDDEGVKRLELSLVDSLIPTQYQVIMAIIIPSYKEDIGTMEDTLSVLASHPLARESYDIYLAMEERDPKATTTAQLLVKSFQEKFSRMQFTVHPAGITGEASGKSSNVSWAAKEVERVYEGQPEWRNVLITTMDSDTHLMPQYFQYLRAAHYRNRRSGYLTDMTLYMPPIVFDRNAHSVPTLVRVADLMWCGAGLSCFLSEPTASGVGIPTAVYTIPLALAQLTNGWDTGPGAIGEDLHMMLKCYFATNGRMNIESIPSPASQCNITSDTRGIRGWFDNVNARYNQGLRHMWGCLDTGFAIRQWCSMGSTPSVAQSPTVGPCSAAQNLSQQRRRKLSHTELSLKLSQYALHGSEPRRFTIRNLIVFTRLFEAHFLPAHLVILIIASAVYTPILKSTPNHYYLTLLLDFTGYMRIISFTIMVIYFCIFYERYHRICISAREREMIKAGLHAHLADQFSHRSRWNLKYWVDYFIFPVAGTLFGSFCLFQAAISHFWTDRLVYLVSAKPVRLALPTAAPADMSTPTLDCKEV